MAKHKLKPGDAFTITLGNDKTIMGEVRAGEHGADYVALMALGRYDNITFTTGTDGQLYLRIEGRV